MIKLFSYNHPVTYILLLGFTFLLRAPSFHGEYFATDESAYIVAAEKIAEGGTQYVDTWDNKPPILVWFYYGFVWLFGDGALIAIRIFTCIYVALCAIILNQVLQESKLLSRFSLLPAFLFVFLVSVPWYAQELNGELLMTLPVTLAFYQLVLLRERGPKNNTYFFIAGLLLGLSVMIKYQALFLLIAALLAAFVLFPPRISEIFSLISGVFLTIGSVLLVVYYSGAMSEFWDIGVLYNFDYVTVGANPGEDIRPFFNLSQYLRLWGVVIVFGLWSIFHFRFNFFKFGIRLRKAETVILLWLAGAFVTILLGSGRLYLHYFVIAVPPLVIYFSRFFELSVRNWAKYAVVLLCIALPASTYGHFLMAAFPETFGFADGMLTKDGWTMEWRKTLQGENELKKHLAEKDLSRGVLVLDFQPEIYMQLNTRCATKYTNFSIAYYKMEVFPHHEDHFLISSSESEAEIHDEFQNDKPQIIIDDLRFGLFQHLKSGLPGMFEDYEGEKAGNYMVYTLKTRQLSNKSGRGEMGIVR